MAELISNLLINRIDFSTELNRFVLRKIVRGHMSKVEEFDFIMYKLLSVTEAVLGKYTEMSRGENHFRVKLHFFVKGASFDEKPIYIIEQIRVRIYKWNSKAHCQYTIRNSALILKIIRILSLKPSKMSDKELFLLIFAPYTSFKPMRFESPQVTRENALLSNLYFDELLLCALSDSSLSLSLHRFKILNTGYLLYPGIVAGLAKPPASSVDYHKPSHFDLAAMPQQGLKYQLIAGVQDTGADLRRYHNVKCISYELRREILGEGLCDIRFEIFVADSPSLRRKSMADDVDITAVNSELFFAAIATRIIKILIHEISRPEYQNKEVPLQTKGSDNPFSRPLHQEIKKTSPQEFTPMNKYFRQNVEVSLEKAIYEYRSNATSKHSLEEILPARHKEKSPETVENVVDKTMFVNRLLRMKALISKDKRASILIGKPPEGRRPKIFKENEVVLFKVSIYPTKSRSGSHKMILSSTDVLKLFNISDFLMEGVGLSVLNWKTVAWIAGMDSKTIFNYFCTFLCGRVIMKRWVIYKRPFFLYSKDITRHMYVHQNTFLLEDQKCTPKLPPFMSVQNLDLEFVYHKVIRHGRLYVIVSIVKMPKDHKFSFRAYVQGTCRTFKTSFKTLELSEVVEDFMVAFIVNLLTQHPSELPSSVNQMVKLFRRTLPSKIPEPVIKKQDSDLKNDVGIILEYPKDITSGKILSKESSLNSASFKSESIKRQNLAPKILKLASSRLIRSYLLPRSRSTLKNHRGDVHPS